MHAIIFYGTFQYVGCALATT